MMQFSVRVVEISTRRLVVCTTDQGSSADAAHLAWSSAYPPRRYRVIITSR